MKRTENNIIYEKSFKFAIDAVELYKHLYHQKKEFVLSKQVLRSGTSIGANVREGLEAQSSKDFISKLYISLKEACETEYWLELLQATKYIDDNQAAPLLNELREIIKILNAIIKTTKRNIE